MTEIAFAASHLDRADHLRGDASQSDLLARGDSRLLVFASDRLLTGPDGAPYWLDLAQVNIALKTHVFLGVDNSGVPHYGAQIDGDIEAELFAHSVGADKFRDARSIAMKLGAGSADLGVIAHAKSLTDWHARHQYCANCGSPTDARKGGAERKCPNCGHTHFPRTDPVVIMLLVKDDHVLLGRGPKMPPGFYSALAGFVEAGETAEAAVARETWEEVGIGTSNIRYVTSQPWPWPSSLMMGFIADADRAEITLGDLDEVDAARWFTRAEISAAGRGQLGGVMVPPPLAIARNLLEKWVAGEI